MDRRELYSRSDDLFWYQSVLFHNGWILRWPHFAKSQREVDGFGRYHSRSCRARLRSCMWGSNWKRWTRRWYHFLPWYMDLIFCKLKKAQKAWIWCFASFKKLKQHGLIFFSKVSYRRWNWISSRFQATRICAPECFPISHKPKKIEASLWTRIISIHNFRAFSVAIRCVVLYIIISDQWCN